MILKRGITSFFNWDERGTIPEFTFWEFKRVIFAVAASLRIQVSNLTERNAGRNYHIAQLNDSEWSVLVLGHSTYPIIAFAQTEGRDFTQLRFVTCSQIADEMQNFFPNLTIATSEELTRELTESDLTLLDEIEREQVKYWQPKTVGQVAFNWWD